MTPRVQECKESCGCCKNFPEPLPGVREAHDEKASNLAFVTFHQLIHLPGTLVHPTVRMMPKSQRRLCWQCCLSRQLNHLSSFYLSAPARINLPLVLLPRTRLDRLGASSTVLRPPRFSKFEADSDASLGSLSARASDHCYLPPRSSPRAGGNSGSWRDLASVPLHSFRR